MPRAAGAVRWCVRELMDESAYERYIAHARSRDPVVSVPSRREFERMRTDRRESARERASAAAESGQGRLNVKALSYRYADRG
jgi:uncharacterized short protein YbdD (DUF466 family)